ncbi:MAG: ATP-dependent DNA helicase RecG [Balneolales bacterium]
MNLKNIQGISPARAKALEQSGITTPDELITLFPRSYLDRRNVLNISQLTGQGEKVTVVGEIITLRESGFGRKKRLEVVLQDGSGQLKGVWFKGISYFRKTLKTGTKCAFFGTARRYGRFLTMAHPEVESLASVDDKNPEFFAGIVPIYPGNQFLKKTYITSGQLQKWIQFILDTRTVKEFLPDEILRAHQFPDRNTAFRWIHAPEHPEQHKKALERFKFEELFLFELCVVTLKKEIVEKNAGHVMAQTKPLTHRFFNETLPFELTDGQKSSLGAIKMDLRSGKQMNRLLQGDVGSGKTVVALGAMLMAIDNHFQAVMMAPTEILAEQHYHTLSGWMDSLGVNIRLLTGNQKKALREDVLSDIAGGTAHIIVGTHAIIQESIRFHRLGLAVIDEQHRFGVSQRALLRDKGENPHILVMSATPIPRSLAMTLYSDLDISIIRDLPPGRKPVRTRVVRESERGKVHSFLIEHLQEGGQAYVVYPLIEESEAIDLKNATEGFDQLRVEFSGFQVGLLHGRMPSDEKEAVMRAFQENRIQILVSTTVIEVGVNVPNASVMIVEHAERFGLSQLHQLRGRIGRGSRQSFCFLLADVKQSKEAKIRLHTMTETDDGFKIAEADLKLRGPGDFLGTRQSGLPEFKHADILNDQYLLEIAKTTALELMSTDPELRDKRHQALKTALLPQLEEKKRFFQMS